MEDRYHHLFSLPETRLFQNQAAYPVVRTEPSAWGEPERHELYVVFERDRQFFELCFERTGPLQHSDAEEEAFR